MFVRFRCSWALVNRVFDSCTFVQVRASVFSQTFLISLASSSGSESQQSIELHVATAHSFPTRMFAVLRSLNTTCAYLPLYTAVPTRENSLPTMTIVFDSKPSSMWSFPAQAEFLATINPNFDPEPSRGRYLIPEAFKTLGFDDSVVQAVKHGVSLGFVHSTIPSVHIENYYSVREHLPAVCAELDRLEQLGVIEQVQNRPWVVNPLGAVSKVGSSKIRIIMDCSASGVNSNIGHFPMTLPSVRDAIRLAKIGYWMVKFDFSDGFFHLPIRQEERDVLGFMHPGNGNFYRYRQMCFGLASAPFIFQTLVEHFRAHLRARGLHSVVIYIDDTLILAPTREDAERAKGLFLEVASQLGFKVNNQKTVGPEQCMQFTGITIDLIQGKLSIPDSKRDKALSRIHSLVSTAREGKSVPVKEVASTVGLLTHLAQITPAGATSIRSLWTALAPHQVRTDGTRSGHAAVMSLSPANIADLEWWRRHIASNPSRRLWAGPDGFLDIWTKDVIPDWQAIPEGVLVLTTDASGTGWGVVASGCNSHTLSSENRMGGGFSDKQAGCSSNWRETKCTELALRKFAHLASGGRILIRSDNSCAVAILNKGHSSSDSLMAIARAIRQIKKQWDVEVVAVHIPGVDNVEADFLSRFTADSYALRSLCQVVLKQVETAARCTVHAAFQIRLQSQVPSNGNRRTCVLNPSDKDDATIAKQSSLWCPGPHEFASTIKRVRKLAELAPSGVRHIVLLPEQLHSPWWGLLRGSQEIRRWPAGTVLFEHDIVLPVPDSVSPPICIGKASTVTWVARTFKPGGANRGRQHPRGHRK